MVQIFVCCMLTFSAHQPEPQSSISKILKKCIQYFSVRSTLTLSLMVAHSYPSHQYTSCRLLHVHSHTQTHTLSGVIPCSCWVCVNPISTFPDSGQGTLISLHPLITLCSSKWSISAPPRLRGPLQDYLLHLHTATQHTHTHTCQIRVLMWGKQGQPAFLAHVKCGSRALAASLSATRFAWGRSEDAPIITDDSTARGWSPSFASTRAGGDSLLKAPPGKCVMEHSCDTKHMWMLCTYSFDASNPASDHTSKSIVLVSVANCKLCQLVSEGCFTDRVCIAARHFRND